MDQHLNNSQNEFLWTLLANPADDAHLYAINLQRLVNDFPQSGILQALLTHASDDKNLRQASVYFDAKSLFKLVNAPSSFIGVASEKIIIQPGIGTNGHYQPAAYQPAGEGPGPGQEENIDNSINEAHVEGDALAEPGHEPAVEHTDHAPEMVVEHVHHAPETVTEQKSHGSEISPEQDQQLNTEASGEDHLVQTTDEVAEGVAVAEPGENTIAESHESIASDVETAPPVPESINTETAPPIAESINTETPPPVSGSVSIETAPPAAEPVSKDQEIIQPEPAIENHIEEIISAVGETVIETPEEEPEKQISEETFDEIVGIEEIEIGPNQSSGTYENTPGEKSGTEAAEEENLIKENIAATDFFMFDQAFGEHKQAEAGANGQPVAAAGGPGITGVPDHQDVSKYHDEKMPYTFMWWLDKTRKEHSGIYQPYIKPETVNINNKSKRPADELQQQYFENIFHITSIEELDKGATPPAAPYNIKRKEQVIIDRFIKEEPQIKPQSSDKLDNENKAKKSSEDRDELVTETLAGIYSDQMLYHKAIASYKKLMLKFPEKSRYFAGKIEQLEKKTN